MCTYVYRAPEGALIQATGPDGNTYALGWMFTCIYMYIYIYAYIYTYIYINIYICIYIYMYIFTHVHMYTGRQRER